MTPDGPKGPESEAASLRNRIESAIVWARQNYDHNGNLIIPREAAANAAWSEVVPELARLTEEVDRLNEVRLNTRDQWRADLDEIADGLGLEKDLPVERIVHWAKDGQSEVSRLREQLAAQPTEAQWKYAQSEIERLEGNESFLERAVHFVLDCCDGSDVPCASDAAEVLYERVRRDIAPAAQQQHKVEVKPQGGGWWKAECAECDLANYTRRRSEADDWKDQHEADTLRPKLESGFVWHVLSDCGDEAVCPVHGRNDSDGRPSGSERLEPRPMETGSVLVNRAELVAGMLVGIGGEHDTVPTQQQLDRAADLIFRSARRRDSTEEGQARLLAVLFDHQCAETGCTDTAADGDVMCPQHLVPDGPQQDAAQAARSEATPKGFGRCVVCGKPGEEHESRQWCMSDQYVDGSWPSPSLRKEQDTHDYLSTACLHEQHDYCVAPVVSREGKWAVIGPSYTTEQGAPKNPAQCKFCSAKCRCGCHRVRGEGESVE